MVSGEDLVKQAMRNPEFGVGHLEKWAEMLQILKDISANRMPSVADLLKQASQAPVAANAQTIQDPDGRHGPRHAVGCQAGRTGRRRRKTSPAVPQVVDRESSQQPPDKNAGQQPPEQVGWRSRG